MRRTTHSWSVINPKVFKRKALEAQLMGDQAAQRVGQKICFGLTLSSFLAPKDVNLRNNTPQSWAMCPKNAGRRFLTRHGIQNRTGRSKPVAQQNYELKLQYILKEPLSRRKTSSCSKHEFETFLGQSRHFGPSESANSFWGIPMSYCKAWESALNLSVRELSPKEDAQNMVQKGPRHLASTTLWPNSGGKLWPAFAYTGALVPDCWGNATKT